MKNKTFNLHTLVSVEAVDRQVCKDITYKPYQHRRSMWGSDTLEGFYCGDTLLTKEQILKGNYKDNENLANFIYNGSPLLIDDNVVYYHPYVKIAFVDGDCIFKYFDTHDEALKYKNEVVDTDIRAQVDAESGKITIKE